MNRNIRIARQLVRIARDLVAESDVKTLRNFLDNNGNVSKETFKDVQDIIEKVLKDEPKAQEIVQEIRENSPEGKRLRRELERRVRVFTNSVVAATGTNNKLIMLAMAALITLSSLAPARTFSWQMQNKGNAGIGKQNGKPAEHVQLEQGSGGSKASTSIKQLSGDSSPEKVLESLMEGKGDTVVGRDSHGNIYLGVSLTAKSTKGVITSKDAKSMLGGHLRFRAEGIAKEMFHVNNIYDTNVSKFDDDDRTMYQVFVLGPGSN